MTLAALIGDLGVVLGARVSRKTRPWPASPVKKWFDENVDTLKYDLQRFKATT